MKTHATIPAPVKAKKPFIQNGKKDTFIRNNTAKKINTSRVIKEENKASSFAQHAVANPQILQAYLKNPLPTNRTARKKDSYQTEPDGLDGCPLPKHLLDAFKANSGEDFESVRLHADELSTTIARQYNAAALTSGTHIYLNTDVYHPNTPDGLSLLAHELFHTIQPGDQHSHIEVQLKPLTELNDQTPEQQAALRRSVKMAQGEKGKVNSGELNEDKTRIGWQFLLEYFETTLGEDRIVEDLSEYKPGKLLEEVIKYVKKGKAQKVRIIDGQHTVVTDNTVDLLPSWCGIFVFWALHKGGIHPPKWEVGKPNFGSKDAYKKGEYLPRPGDIVIKSGYNHHALVVRTEPETIIDTRELQNVKVITINGNTAGSNHQGGQIQEKTDPYSYWDFYINPFFDGVELTKAEDYTIDARLKESVGQEPPKSLPEARLTPAATSVNQYDTTIKPVGDLNIPKAGGEKTPTTEVTEESPLTPKEIMAQDAEFGQLNSALDKNAKNQQAHDPAEQKVEEAQKSAVSPRNERGSKAKAVKVEKLGALPKPKEFRAEDLKNNILKEVDKLLKEKEEEANKTGNKPKIKENEITEVKQANAKDIKSKKTESIGEVETTHKQAPDESSIEDRGNIDVIVEEAGQDKRIPNTEKAVAKPIAEERITLEAESGEIDQKMAENDVDETQLEESKEDQFVSSLAEKRGSQAEAAKVKDDYREIENEKLEKDKKKAGATISRDVENIHDTRKAEFGNVNTSKEGTKSKDEIKRKEISDAIEKIYTDSEKSVNDKLLALEESVNVEFDSIMAVANGHFRDNVNAGLDDEFTWEWAAKRLDRSDYNRRVKKVFVRESDKYKQELSDALTPLTTKIADTLNAIVAEIQKAKEAVIVFVNGLDPDLAKIGVESAKEVLLQFGTLEESVNEKQEALTNNLAKKYADGVAGLEAELKKILDSRKSWLEKALDAIVNAIMAIINLFGDLIKALKRAARYGSQIMKSPGKFFDTLSTGASQGFSNFKNNIGKHLLTTALEWVTGEMAETGIQIPAQFDFKGILSIILQILGITVENVTAIAKKVIEPKYVALLEKGVDLGIKGGDKLLTVFTIIKKEGIIGLWAFIKAEFNDLKEQLMEEAKSFIIAEIVEAAVKRLLSLLIPGLGFIMAIKTLIDFLRTLFANIGKIIQIIIGIIDTFGEAVAGNVSKVASLVEGVFVRLLGLAISFLASVLGLNGIGKKIRAIIQKKIKDPINAAITKMMQKLKGIMTKLGVFKFLDKVDEKVKKGKQWVDDKKEKVMEKAKEGWEKFKKWASLRRQFKTPNGETHSIYFSKTKDPNLMIASTPMTFTAFISSLKTTEENKDKKQPALIVAEKIDEQKKESVDNQKSKKTAEQKEEKEEEIATKLKALFHQLAELAATLFDTSGVPKVVDKFGPRDSKSEFGTSANILYLNKKFSKNGSAPTSSNTSVYELLNLRRNGGSSYYIKGHLLNQKMGGKGDWNNLTPLSRSGNAQHETNIESVGKTFYGIISCDQL